MLNGYGGKKYDFKRSNGTDKVVYEPGVNYINIFRGMPILDGKNGKPIYASARDIGNIGAGLVAGKAGMGWSTARLGFNTLESWQNNHLTTEDIGTQYGEKLGWRIGNQMYQNYQISEQRRLPGNGHLNNFEISKDVISYGDL